MISRFYNSWHNEHVSELLPYKLIMKIKFDEIFSRNPKFGKIDLSIHIVLVTITYQFMSGLYKCVIELYKYIVIYYTRVIYTVFYHV